MDGAPPSQGRIPWAIAPSGAEEGRHHPAIGGSVGPSVPTVNSATWLFVTLCETKRPQKAITNLDRPDQRTHP